MASQQQYIISHKASLNKHYLLFIINDTPYSSFPPSYYYPFKQTGLSYNPASYSQYIHDYQGAVWCVINNSK